jgi:hypothetical protein
MPSGFDPMGNPLSDKIMRQSFETPPCLELVRNRPWFNGRPKIGFCLLDARWTPTMLSTGRPPAQSFLPAE